MIGSFVSQVLSQYAGGFDSEQGSGSGGGILPPPPSSKHGSVPIGSHSPGSSLGPPLPPPLPPPVSYELVYNDPGGGSGGGSGGPSDERGECDPMGTEPCCDDGGAASMT